MAIVQAQCLRSWNMKLTVGLYRKFGNSDGLGDPTAFFNDIRTCLRLPRCDQLMILGTSSHALIAASYNARASMTSFTCPVCLRTISRDSMPTSGVMLTPESSTDCCFAARAFARDRKCLSEYPPLFRALTSVQGQGLASESLISCDFGLVGGSTDSE